MLEGRRLEFYQEAGKPMNSGNLWQLDILPGLDIVFTRLIYVSHCVDLSTDCLWYGRGNEYSWEEIKGGHWYSSTGACSKEFKFSNHYANAWCGIWCSRYATSIPVNIRYRYLGWSVWPDSPSVLLETNHVLTVKWPFLSKPLSVLACTLRPASVWVRAQWVMFGESVEKALLWDTHPDHIHRT